jgi:hypothetical protein
VTDYTDIISRFSEPLPAETLAKFIADAGIPCDVVENWSVVDLARYCVRVQRSRLAELKETLKLTPVASGLSGAAAQIVAGQLAQVNIPCYIGGWHSMGDYFDISHAGDDPLKETTVTGAMIAVPEPLSKAATRVPKQPVPENELSALALRTAPDPQDPI